MTKKDLIIQAFDSDNGFDRTALSKTHGINRPYISQVLQNYRGNFTGVIEDKTGVDLKDNDSAKADYKGETATVETRSFKIKSAEEACKYAEVNMDIWEVERQIVNFWDVTMKVKNNAGVEVPETRRNYQIKVWLRRKIKKNIEEALERLVERIPDFKYSKFTPTHFGSRSGYAAEIAPLDAHLGKLAWAMETQQRDYDLKIGVDDYAYANDQSLEWISPFCPEKIFYILGQDLMHTENLEGVTHRGGNVLDVDSRLDKLMDAAIDITIKNINRCRSMAPVEVILVPGNHDLYASKWLARCLDRHYRKDKHVEVDYGPNNRKARLWGQTLVGWSHEIPPAKAAAYVNELAQIFKEEWSKAEYVEIHYGHKHKKAETKTLPVTTHGGVLLRQLTALSPIDYWHYDNMFTDAVPGGESFVWHKELGVVANFTAWTKHFKKRSGEK